MTTLLLVRHGETDWNAEHRYQGHADVPLNERGRVQARALAEDLASGRIGTIYTSDLARARETAEIVGARLRIPVAADRDLREIDVGAVEGLTFAEAQTLGGWRGETKEQHSRRILGAVRRIGERHPDGRVLVVTHGGSVRRIHEHLGLADVPIENCAIWPCTYEDGVLRAID